MNAKCVPTSWWKILLGTGAILGAGYLVYRSLQKTKYQHSALRAVGCETSIMPGMSLAERNRTWDSYYGKKGLKLIN
jgi:hypothetical protein